jgi:hypothetical protein
MDRPSRSLRARNSPDEPILRFAFYVEGPSDWHILRLCARHASPRLSRVLDPHSVILGGRQPARALQHFRDLRAKNGSARGLCVLDRDRGDDDVAGYPVEAGLRFYTWPRRHIESYLLVPGAIGRCAGFSASDARFRRILGDHLPTHGADDTDAYRSVDAKKLLSPRSPLSQALGAPLSVGRVAQALRKDDVHPDILGVFALVRDAMEPVSLHFR